MTQQTSPFLEANYGWAYGESGWNTGMDQNLLKFSYLFDRTVESLVPTLPAAVNGKAYYNTSDNRIYYAVGTTYYSTPVPIWFEFKLKTTGETYIFNGTSALTKPISSNVQNALDLKAPISNPTFTGTVSGITPAMVGLGNVNNTSDANKPVSTAVQTALDTKAAKGANSDITSLSALSTAISVAQGGTGATTPQSARTNLGFDLSSGQGAGAYIGYRGRTVAARLDDIFNVKDYGAVGDGVTNDSPAFQAAFNAAKVRGRGFIYAPGAQYLLNTLVTAQDFHWAFFGDGQEQTVILVNNTTGGISFTSTGRTGTEWMSITGGYTLVSYASGAGSVTRGKGLSIVYPTTSFAPATPNCIIDDIHCRGVGYSINTAADPYFTDGIYIRNASNSKISRFNSDQNANKLYTGINLDYPTTDGKFRVSIDNFSLQGGLYGIRAVGAIENLQIDNYEIGVPVYGIYCDATGVAYQTPLVTIGKGHINATKYPIFTKNWKSIQIVAPEIAVSFDAAYSGSSNSGIRIESGNLIEMTGGSINNIDSATTTSMVELVGSTNFTITGMTYDVNAVAGKTQQGIALISGTKDGTIVGNTAKSSATSTFAFVFAQTGNATDDGILVSNNRANGFTYGIATIGVRGLRGKNNDFTGCFLPVNVGGTPYPGVVFEGNTPFLRTSINNNSATPNVAGIPDGAISLFNTTATTITNFLNGSEGQTIKLFAANGNTTVAHNANIFLQGSPAGGFPMPAASMLTLQYVSGTWIEQGRRT